VIKVGLDQTPPMVAWLCVLECRSNLGARLSGTPRIVFDRISVQNYFVIGLHTMALSYFCTYWARNYFKRADLDKWTALPIMVGIFARYMLPNERMSRHQILSVMIALSGLSSFFRSTVDF
jgi:drug/metabolite transporter (DMT)-like permease